MKHKATKHSVSVVFCTLYVFNIHAFANTKSGKCGVPPPTVHVRTVKSNKG